MILWFGKKKKRLEAEEAGKVFEAEETARKAETVAEPVADADQPLATAKAETPASTEKAAQESQEKVTA